MRISKRNRLVIVLIIKFSTLCAIGQTLRSIRGNDLPWLNRWLFGRRLFFSVCSGQKDYIQTVLPNLAAIWSNSTHHNFLNFSHSLATELWLGTSNVMLLQRPQNLATMFHFQNALLPTVLAILLIIHEMFIVVSADTWLSNEKSLTTKI